MITHKGFIDWETYEMNQARIAKNTRPLPHKASGAIREGSALLQGLATCGRCGVASSGSTTGGKYSTPGYYCASNKVMEGRGEHCMRVGGVQIDQSVSDVFLDAITPAAVDACLLAEKNLESEHDTAISQWQLQLERLRYEADRAERRYRTVEPENRLVARTLETQWELCLGKLKDAEKEFERKQKAKAHKVDARSAHLYSQPWRRLRASLASTYNYLSRQKRTSPITS